jgi:hypothetical protein
VTRPTHPVVDHASSSVSDIVARPWFGRAALP